MQQRLSELERMILVGLHEEIATVLATGYPAGYGHTREKLAHDDAAAGLVHVNNIRHGVATGDGAGRMAVSRAYVSLEKRGLVERVATGYTARTTHLFLTEAGRATAEQLRAEASA